MLETRESWDTCRGQLLTEWNQEVYCINKAEQSWRWCFDAEFGVCPPPLFFGLVLVQYFFTILHSLHFGMLMDILSHYML